MGRRKQRQQKNSTLLRWDIWGSAYFFVVKLQYFINATMFLFCFGCFTIKNSNVPTCIIENEQEKKRRLLQWLSKVVRSQQSMFVNDTRPVRIWVSDKEKNLWQPFSLIWLTFPDHQIIIVEGRRLVVSTVCSAKGLGMQHWQSSSTTHGCNTKWLYISYEKIKLCSFYCTKILSIISKFSKYLSKMDQ